jgi:hypothetical protein
MYGNASFPLDGSPWGVCKRGASGLMSVGGVGEAIYLGVRSIVWTGKV